MARVEKETSINFNKFDDFANVYTTQIKIINRLNKLSSKYPEYCKKEADYFYQVDKSLITFKNPRIIDKKTRLKLISNLKNKSL
jgi:hypothetical protein